MAFTLKLPNPWESRGWKVKIRDRERVEPPHVTIMHKAKAWRFGLRTSQFLDSEPDPNLIPDEVLDAIRTNLSMLCEAWDRIYPENPVISKSPKEPWVKKRQK